jgi:hypothetical protein
MHELRQVNEIRRKGGAHIAQAEPNDCFEP